MARFWETGGDSSASCPDLVRLVRLLSTPIHMEVLLALRFNELDVTSIAEALELDLSMVSRSLRRLHAFQMVKAERRKQKHIYSLGPAIDISIDDGHMRVTSKAADGAHVTLTIPRMKK